MLSGAIAYQILRQEAPSTISRVRAVLEHHPWYESRLRSELEIAPESERDGLLFMLAARWADDVRTQDHEQSLPLWHYINLPFKPDGQPINVHALPPQNTKVVTALVDNERIVTALTQAERPSPLPGSFIWLETSTNRCIRRKYSQWTIRRVTEAGTKSASENHPSAAPETFTLSGMELSRRVRR
jgi:hypothetical protein